MTDGDSETGSGPRQASVRVIARFRPPTPAELVRRTSVAELHAEDLTKEESAKLKTQKMKGYQITQGSRQFPWIFDNETAAFVGGAVNLPDGSTKDEGAARYTFDMVYPPTAQQEDVFEGVALPTVKDVLKGYNGTIFAYGQSGSGKTFTISGDWSEEADWGILPRTAAAIFDGISSQEQVNMETHVTCAYLEVYKEVIQDLLTPGVSGLPVRENPSKGVYVEGLRWVNVNSPGEVCALLAQGESIRATAATNLNERSSRSHSVFVFQVTSHNRVSGVTRVGRLNLCDLAGSENVRQSGAAGERLEEAKRINQSLSSLGRCIKLLSDLSGCKTVKSAHIPYRDSVLTRILKESLHGNTKTTLLVTASPHVQNANETLSTLKFAHRAKKLENTVKVNEARSTRELKLLVESLTKEVDALRSGTGVSRYGDNSNQTYKKYLEGILSDRQITASELVLLEKERMECHITKEQHYTMLEELGFSLDQWDDYVNAGSVSEHYKTFLRAIVADSHISNEELKEMHTMREILGIDEEEHKNTLQALGFSQISFESLVSSSKEQGYNEYISCIKACISDGSISPDELHLLNTLRQVYSIDEDTHVELVEKAGWTKEKFESAINETRLQGMSEYKYFLRACLVDGVISIEEETALAEIRTEFGLSYEQHLDVLEELGSSEEHFESIKSHDREVDVPDIQEKFEAAVQQIHDMRLQNEAMAAKRDEERKEWETERTILTQKIADLTKKRADRDILERDEEMEALRSKVQSLEADLQRANAELKCQLDEKQAEWDSERFILEEHIAKLEEQKMEISEVVNSSSAFSGRSKNLMTSPERNGESTLLSDVAAPTEVVTSPLKTPPGFENLSQEAQDSDAINSIMWLFATAEAEADTSPQKDNGTDKYDVTIKSILQNIEDEKRLIQDMPEEARPVLRRGSIMSIKTDLSSQMVRRNSATAELGSPRSATHQASDAATKGSSGVATSLGDNSIGDGTVLSSMTANFVNMFASDAIDQLTETAAARVIEKKLTDSILALRNQLGHKNWKIGKQAMLLKSLSEKNDELRNRSIESVKVHQSDLLKMQKNIRDLEKDLKISRDEVTQLEKSLEDSNGKVKVLREQLTQKNWKIGKQSTMVDLISEKMKALKEEHVNLVRQHRKDLTRMQKSILALESEKKVYVDTISRLNAAVVVLQNEKDANLITIAELTASNNLLKSANKTIRDTAEDLAGKAGAFEALSRQQLQAIEGHTKSRLASWLPTADDEGLLNTKAPKGLLENVLHSLSVIERFVERSQAQHEKWCDREQKHQDRIGGLELFIEKKDADMKSIVEDYELKMSNVRIEHERVTMELQNSLQKALAHANKAEVAGEAARATMRARAEENERFLKEKIESSTSDVDSLNTLVETLMSSHKSVSDRLEDAVVQNEKYKHEVQILRERLGLNAPAQGSRGQLALPSSPYNNST